MPNWNDERFLYAIFTLNKEKKVNGVYVGSANDIGKRISSHLNPKKEQYNERIAELHRIMNEGNFLVRPLNSVNYKERWQEYDWIRFFRDYTNLKVYNTLVDCHSDKTMDSKFTSE